jgi:serine/threonine-protein kinase RIO1
MDTVIRYALQQLGVDRIGVLGSGKSAKVLLVSVGEGARKRQMALRVSMTSMNMSPTSMDEYYDHQRRAIAASHRQMKRLLPANVPQLRAAHIVKNKKGRGIGLAILMDHIDGPTLAGIDKLSVSQCNKLRHLLHRMWKMGIAHGDLIEGNLLWSKISKRWYLIDFDYTKFNKDPHSARRRDLLYLRSRLRECAAQRLVSPSA